MKKTFLFVLLVLFSAPLLAEEDEPMDSEDRLAAEEEDIRLFKDSYDKGINMALESAIENDEAGWFNARAAGKFVTWKDMDIEMPQGKLSSVEEIPYGFKFWINGKKNEQATVKVLSRDSDLYYDVSFGRKAPAEFVRMVKAIFETEGVLFYREGTPCSRKAVSCLHEYEQGTLGILKK